MKDLVFLNRGCFINIGYSFHFFFFYDPELITRPICAHEGTSLLGVDIIQILIFGWGRVSRR